LFTVYLLSSWQLLQVNVFDVKFPGDRPSLCPSCLSEKHAAVLLYAALGDAWALVQTPNKLVRYALLGPKVLPSQALFLAWNVAGATQGEHACGSHL
jgi:hypothetical protein